MSRQKRSTTVFRIQQRSAADPWLVIYHEIGGILRDTKVRILPAKALLRRSEALCEPIPTHRDWRTFMPCNCQSSKQVAQPNAQSIQARGTPATGATLRNQGRPVFASIRYTGPTSTTTTGPVSGRQYKFSHNGAVIQVDARDRAAITKVPHLRQI